MSSIPTLVYTGGRGLAEIIRLVLTASSVDFKEDHIKSQEKLTALKRESPFEQVPILRIDGKNLVQSSAIVRHLARTHNLYGKDENERTKVDMYFDGTRDLYRPFSMIGLAFPLDKVKETTKDNVERYLHYFEKILKSNGSNGHLVGSSLTIADLGLLEIILVVKDYYEPNVFDPYPEIKNFLSSVCKLPFYQKYATQIRRPKNDENYVKFVNSTFSFVLPKY